MSGRNWCFTLNNYTEEETDQAKLGLPFRYMIFGYEVGENGTPHLQGYVEFNAVHRLARLKKWLPRAHFETRKGTKDQAIDYCKKDGKYEEFGETSKQGERTDLDRTRKLAIEEGMRAVTTVCNLQQIKVAEKFLTYNEEPRDFETEVIYIYGKTGVGKSRLAREIMESRGLMDDTYVKSDDSKWWDGYDGHKGVIVDDFRDSWWKPTEMLRLMDRYECRVEVKGGYRQFKPELMIITSIVNPYDLYKNTEEPRQQFIRRIREIRHLE